MKCLVGRIVFSNPTKPFDGITNYLSAKNVETFFVDAKRLQSTVVALFFRNGFDGTTPSFHFWTLRSRPINNDHRFADPALRPRSSKPVKPDLRRINIGADSGKPVLPWSFLSRARVGGLLSEMVRIRFQIVRISFESNHIYCRLY